MAVLPAIFKVDCPKLKREIYVRDFCQIPGDSQKNCPCFKWIGYGGGRFYLTCSFEIKREEKEGVKWLEKQH